MPASRLAALDTVIARADAAISARAAPDGDAARAMRRVRSALTRSIVPTSAPEPKEQAACRRDVQRHCRSVIDQGDFTILACLKENRAKISAACDQVLKNNGQ